MLLLTLGTAVTILLIATSESTCVVDRGALIDAAIQEAKNHAKIQAEIALTDVGKALHAFKLPSPESLRTGKARILLEDIVRRAETKLIQTRQVVAKASEDLEVLAEELLHTPGSLLTKDEMAKVFQESDCSEANFITQSKLDCSLKINREYRTPDGECNNLNNPSFGAAPRPYRRLLPAQYEDGISRPRGTLQSQGSSILPDPFAPPNPSAEFVSEAIVEDRSFGSGFSHFLMQWGQFIDHDVDETPAIEGCSSSCVANTDACLPIRIKSDDDDSSKTCLTFPRSIAACGSHVQGELKPREQINEITSFIDGSQVYGSKEALTNRLREVDDSGEFTSFLRTGDRIPISGGGPSLPLATQSDIDSRFIGCPGGVSSKCFLAGDIRANEQTALTVMHTIWMREHNRIVGELEKINPHWSTDKVFRETRQIVGAEIQKITFKDYLPKILGQDLFDELIGPYPGYDSNTDPTIPNSFAAAAFRFGHSQVRPEFVRLDETYDHLSIGPLPLREAFFNPIQFERSGGTDPILRGLATTTSRKVDEYLTSVLTKELFSLDPKSKEHGDLAAFNIQRGRDHGIAPYLGWKSWATQTCGKTSNIRNSVTNLCLRDTYGSLDTVDLWLGGLAEQELPGALVGATFACIFAKTFGPLRNSDRFYFENVKEDNSEGFFTSAQRDEIKKTSLSRVICDNADNIQDILPDAFRTDQDFEQCTNIPKMNLAVWSEEEKTPADCAMQVRVKNHGQSFNFQSSSSLLTDPSSGDTVRKARREPGQDFICLPFICPTTQLRSLATVSVLDGQCTLDSYNQQLPGNRDRSSKHDTYQGSFTQFHVGYYTGAYPSLADCESGGVGGLYYSCTGKQNLQAQLVPPVHHDNKLPHHKQIIGALQSLINNLENKHQSQEELSDRSRQEETTKQSNNSEDLLALISELVDKED